MVAVVQSLVVSHSCNPMDCSPPGSSVHGILQARILEWVAIYFFRGSSCLGIMATIVNNNIYLKFARRVDLKGNHTHRSAHMHTHTVTMGGDGYVT